MIQEGTTTELDFQLQVKNVAAAAMQNNILSVTSPASNYKVTVRLSNVNIETGGTDTLGLSTVDLLIPSDAQQVLNCSCVCFLFCPFFNAFF